MAEFCLQPDSISGKANDEDLLAIAKAFFTLQDFIDNSIKDDSKDDSGLFVVLDSLAERASKITPQTLTGCAIKLAMSDAYEPAFPANELPLYTRLAWQAGKVAREMIAVEELISGGEQTSPGTGATG